MHTLADCVAIEALAADATGAVVVGAGVLGLEVATALARRGLLVTVLQRGQQMMQRQLDAPASRVLSRTLRSLGVRVRPGAGVSAVLGTHRVRAVALDDGSVLDADLLVLCCGARPRVDLARAAGLAVATAVVVDDQLRSITDPHISAIGDCAEHRGRTYGLVAPAWEQARVAARAIAQPGNQARYPGSRIVIRLKAAGVELASLGDAVLADALLAGEGDADAGDVEVIRFTDSSRGVYQKLVVRDGRLTGAILLGDTRTAGAIMQLFDRGAALPADRSSLLLSRPNPEIPSQSPATLPGQATICHCNGVSKGDVCAAWQGGARRIADIAARPRATTGCGTCREDIEGIIGWLASTQIAADGAGDDSQLRDRPPQQRGAACAAQTAPEPGRRRERHGRTAASRGGCRP